MRVVLREATKMIRLSAAVADETILFIADATDGALLQCIVFRLHLGRRYVRTLALIHRLERNALKERLARIATPQLNWGLIADRANRRLTGPRMNAAKAKSVYAAVKLAKLPLGRALRQLGVTDRANSCRV